MYAMRGRNHRPLETLLAYNIADAVNLEALLDQAYNLKLRRRRSPKRICSHSLFLPFHCSGQTMKRWCERYGSPVKRRKPPDSQVPPPGKARSCAWRERGGEGQPGNVTVTFVLLGYPGKPQVPVEDA